MHIRPFQGLLFKTVHDMVYKFNKKKLRVMPTITFGAGNHHQPLMAHAYQELTFAPF